ncbi:uncharacterized protein V6R79_024044 [Siganus canaliculatus]
MSSVQHLKEFVHERLTVAAEEIFELFKNTVVKYEEELQRHRRQNNSWVPEINVRKMECTEELHSNQPQYHKEMDSNQDPDPLQIKKEEEDLYTSQEEDQTMLNTHTFVLTAICDEQDQNPPEPTSDNIFHSFQMAVNHDQRVDWHEVAGLTGNLETKSEELNHRGQSFNNDASESNGNIDTVKKDFICDTCGEAFKLKSCLDTHMGSHHGEKPFSCEICGNRFSRASALKTHTYRIHIAKKPLSCKTCGKRFNFNSTLLAHQTTHTGEKPYLCKTCGKRFGDRTTLSQHTRIHTGEKPYKCKICSRDFRVSGHLKRHMATHTDERPYTCTTCGKHFRTEAHRKRHMKTHKVKDGSLQGTFDDSSKTSYANETNESDSICPKSK